MKKLKMKELSWNIYNTEYLAIQLLRQIRRRRVSRELIRELTRRGILEKILEMLREDKEFSEEFRETIEFIKNVTVTYVIQETLGRKWRIPEKLAKFPEIVNDWLREEYEEVIDTFEDEKFRYKLVFDGDFRIILEWKL